MMTLEQAKALKLGDRVRISERCMGEDHDGREHTVEAGCIGKVCDLATFPAPQGFAVTVWIPVTPNESHGIVNVFDEADDNGRYPFEIVT